MTTLAKLLARKQQLLERLQEGPGTHERDEIERLLAEIDEALTLLDEAGPGTSGEKGIDPGQGVTNEKAAAE
jgi:hypothetical protein